MVDPETGKTLGPGEFGEICVRGYSVMQGLYKVEREDAFDADGYYHTGDAGFFDAEGHLFFKGRLGEMIKTGGANVAPRELELLLAAMPEILAAHAVGIPHKERGENVARRGGAARGRRSSTPPRSTRGSRRSSPPTSSRATPSS